MSNLKKDEEGATLVFVGVCLAVLLGLAALTFDLGRVAATQTDMQAFADHVALAAAGELDGQPDAITRATAAAEQLINDRQTFARGDQALGGAADFDLRFLTGLPNSDREYFDPTDDLTGFVTTSGVEATLVEVTTTQRSVFLPFFRAFAVLQGTEPSDGIVGARAVAGFTKYACDIASLMFCLPSGFDIDAEIGASVQLRTGGNNAAWGPGDFGFLDPSDNAIDPNGPCANLTGVQQDACLIASSGNRTRCFAQGGVDLAPGQQVGIENAVFNTRFDMYNGTMSNNRNNSIFAPSAHAVTGLVDASGTGNGNGNQCLGNNVALSTDSMAFPPDTCHGSTCGRFGDKGWDRATYMQVNHGYASLADAQAEGAAFEGMNLATASRYDVYKRELENAASNGGRILPASNPDSSNQTCTTQTPSTNPNRRVFIAAGIDCDANNINGAASGVPVKEYFEVFLMRPVGDGSGNNGNTSTFDMYVEFLGSAGGDGSGSADDGGIFRDVVELYR